MTTILFRELEYNVVYIDPSIETAGDGSTHTTALNAFPSTLVDQTCYLIRRTSKEQYATLNATSSSTITNNNLKNFMIMGMPKSTDEEYSLITDETVKTAWADEEHEYANVLQNGSLRIPNVMKMSFTRTFFFRNYGNTDMSNVGPYPMFRRDYNSIIENEYSDSLVNINYCKFGHYYFEADNEEYRNSTVFDEKYYVKCCKQYLYMSGIGKLNFKNTITNYSSFITNKSMKDVLDLNWESSDNFSVTNNNAFYFNVLNDCNVENNDFNLIYSKNAHIRNNYSYDYDYEHRTMDQVTSYDYYKTFTSANTCLSIVIHKEITMIYKNNNINHILYSDNYLPITPMILSNTYGNYYNHQSSTMPEGTIKYSNLKMENIKIRTLTFKNARPGLSNEGVIDVFQTVNNHLSDSLRNYIGYKTGSIIIHGLFNGYIRNIDAKSNIVDTIPVLFVDQYNYQNAIPTKTNLKVSNINVKYAQSPIDVVGYNERNSVLSAININGYDAYTISSTKYHQKDKARLSPVQLENINIDAPLATALNLTHTNIKDATVSGKVLIDHTVNGTIDKITSKNLSESTMTIKGETNNLQVEEIFVDYNNAFGTPKNLPLVDYTTDTYYGNSKIKIGKTNAICFKDSQKTQASSFNDGFVVCTNHGQDGQFIQGNALGKITSCNAVRGGSIANASLKFDLAGTTDNVYSQKIGSKDFDAMLLTPTEIGNKTITVYLMTEQQLSNEEIKENFIIDLYQKDMSGQEPKMTFAVSSTSGVISDDTSSWTTVDGFAKKIEIPFEVVSTENKIQLNIENKMLNKGSIFMDPDVKIA